MFILPPSLVNVSLHVSWAPTFVFLFLVFYSGSKMGSSQNLTLVLVCPSFQFSGVLGVVVPFCLYLNPLTIAFDKVRKARVSCFFSYSCLWLYCFVFLKACMLLWWCEYGMVCFLAGCGGCTRESGWTSAELAQASWVVALNESSYLSKELSPEREQQQFTPSLFRGLA